MEVRGSWLQPLVRRPLAARSPTLHPVIAGVPTLLDAGDAEAAYGMEP